MIKQNQRSNSENESSEAAEIFIYDDIGPTWAGMVGAKGISQELKALGKVDEIYVRINSFGGSVYEGLAIYKLLARHGAKIIIDIDGIAASAASYIAMAGDEIRIAESAQMMIHNPWTIMWGFSEDLRKEADELDKVALNIAKIYAARSGMEIKDIQDFMADETWFTAEDAKDINLVDTVTENKAKAAAFNSERFHFKNMPESVKALIKECDEEEPRKSNKKKPERNNSKENLKEAKKLLDEMMADK